MKAVVFEHVPVDELPQKWREKLTAAGSATVMRIAHEPQAVRRVVYTTNAIESVHSRLRKIIKTSGHFPSDDAATKLIWLALRNITADWGRAANEWRAKR